MSEAMPSAQSVAIAGGGIIGLTIAWRLAQLGLAVTVYDKGAPGGEASWAGAGMLAPGGEFDAISELAALALESRRLYPGFVRKLEEASRRPIDFQERGALDLAYSSAELASLESRAAAQQRLGIPSKPLTPSQVATFWPHIRKSGLAGARFYRQDAIVDPRHLVTALMEVCRKSNIILMPDCPVERVSVGGAGVRFHTSQGVSDCDFAVIAAGAWSSSLDVEGVPALPRCEPVRGHLIAYQQPAHTCETIVRHGHTYLLQRANGLLIAGASAERVGFVRDIDPSAVGALASEASFVFPHLAETSPAETWVGFRPLSDSVHLGAWHSPRLLLAYGHYRNGILLAPVTAARIAAAVNASSRTQ
ncbi:MAG: glycine oxidase ThiO [Acidobacteriaceae bacterium]|nr:glycine oxidase ThiO [Acidobacteriaceae bacterium]